MICIGHLKLLSLAYIVDNPTEVKLVGEAGNCGVLNVNLVPTDKEGYINLSEEMDENDELNEPEDLLNKQLDFLVMIDYAKLS